MTRAEHIQYWMTASALVGIFWLFIMGVML